jgi:hypothetical protein
MKREEIEANWEERVEMGNYLETLVIHEGIVYYHANSIIQIANYIEERRQFTTFDNNEFTTFVNTIINNSYRRLEDYAKRKNFTIYSFSNHEYLINMKLTVRTHARLNEELEELIDQSLDDLQNPANENPLNLK